MHGLDLRILQADLLLSHKRLLLVAVPWATFAQGIQPAIFALRGVEDLGGVIERRGVLPDLRLGVIDRGAPMLPRCR